MFRMLKVEVVGRSAGRLTEAGALGVGTEEQGEEGGLGAGRDPDLERGHGQPRAREVAPTE